MRTLVTFRVGKVPVGEPLAIVLREASTVLSCFTRTVVKQDAWHLFSGSFVLLFPFYLPIPASPSKQTSLLLTVQ
jgi:hypothetical protein